MLCNNRHYHCPLQHRLSLIEGPPGTGKTHLLGWILVALILHAQEQGRPLRIAVSALTHQAIDQVLKQSGRARQTTRLSKLSRPMLQIGTVGFDRAYGVEPLADVETLAEFPYAILGAARDLASISFLKVSKGLSRRYLIGLCLMRHLKCSFPRPC